MKIKFRYIVASMFLIVGLFGFKAVAERYSELQIFSKVLNFVQQYYVEEVDTKKLVYGAIKGMLNELDPHTNFLPPKLFKDFQSETSGEFGGIGIEITQQDGYLTVISPIEDTPAWKAGILSGDKIIGIDGHATKGLSLSEAAQLMRGKTGSKIKLKVKREGKKEAIVFNVKRAKVKIRSIKYVDLEEGYAYIRMTSFIEKTYNDFIKQIKKHKKKNKTLKGLIIDLRNNPGGLLDQAVRISDMFLEKGTIVSTRGRNESKQEVMYAKSEGTQENYPIIILVNEYSASASEILAGALQDNQRAVIMGRRSFGKGSVQSVIKLDDGSALKLTVAKYFTPSGESIQAKGIVPDIIVENVNPDAYRKAIVKKNVRREGDMQKALRGTEKKAKNNWADKEDGKLTPRDRMLKRDFEVLQAYNYLKAWKVFKTFKKTQ